MTGLAFRERKKKKKKVYHLWKNDQATQVDCRNVVRLYRNKIRSTKAQIECNLATAVNVYKYISNSRRAEDHLHPLWDMMKT